MDSWLHWLKRMIRTRTFRLTPADLERIGLKLYWEKKRALYAFGALYGIGTIVFGVVQGFSLLIALGAFLLLLPLLQMLYMRIWYRRYARSPKNASFFVAGFDEIDEHSIRSNQEDGSSSVIPWERVIESRPFGEAIVLFVAEMTFLLFRREYFESDTDWEAFRGLAALRPQGKPL